MMMVLVSLVSVRSLLFFDFVFLVVVFGFWGPGGFGGGLCGGGGVSKSEIWSL